MGGFGSGRYPAKRSLAEEEEAVLRDFRKYFRQVDPNDAEGKTRLQRSWEAFYKLCAPNHNGLGSKDALKELFSRMMGKPVENVSVEVSKSREELMAEAVEAINAIREKRGEPKIQ